MLYELAPTKTTGELAEMKISFLLGLTISGNYSVGNVTFNIVSVSANTVGVPRIDIFARVFIDGKQLGFGKNGTVDIERFVFYNPPILVPDNTGTITTTWTDEVTQQQYTRRFREDPLAAILETLAHTAKMVGKVGTAIVPNSIGNTTSTFYPDASNTDGRALIISAASWNAAVTGNGNYSDYGTATLQLYTNSDDNRIDRIFLLFDTSGIPDTDTISSATISVYGSSKSQQGVVNMAMNITQANPASNSAIANADYQATLPYTTKLSDTSISYASFSTTGYNDWALNSSGIANISKTGTSKFSWRYDGDIDNSGPGTGAGTDDQNMNALGYVTAGTSQDPKLVVVHSGAVSTSIFLPLLGVG